MCLGIPLSQKKQPAFGLLPNWTYAFARNTPYISKSGQAHVPGLFIYHPDYETKTFRSIEAAVVYVPKLRTYNQNVVTDFNTHIGIFARDRANSKKQRAEPRRTSLAVSQKPNAAGVRTSGLSPRDLYANRCKQCELCMKQDCGACWSCKSNKKNPNRSRRAVCLKNVRACAVNVRDRCLFLIPQALTRIFLCIDVSCHPRRTEGAASSGTATRIYFHIHA